MTAGSMHCAGHSPLSACKQCTTLSPCVHLHPLVCRKPFRRYGCGSRCSSGRKTSRALRTPVKAKVASFAQPEPYLVRAKLVDLRFCNWPAGVWRSFCGQTYSKHTCTLWRRIRNTIMRAMQHIGQLAQCWSQSGL